MSLPAKPDDDPTFHHREYVSRSLRARRQELGLTQKEMGRRVALRIYVTPNVAVTTIYFWENGNPYGTPSKIGRERYGHMYMARLGVYIQELSFDVEELTRIVGAMNAIDARFTFPPDESKLKNILA